MFNLLCIIPSDDGTSHYRGMGPIGALARTSKMDINLVFAEQCAEGTAYLLSGVFVQRPFMDDHLRVAKMYREMGVPLWVDYDDDLFNVPVDNSAHYTYGGKQIRNNIREILLLRDKVTVSTLQLKKQLSMESECGLEKITVIPNAF